MKILHLYPDLMNLYGENANLIILKIYLEAMGISVFLDEKKYNEDINFNEYDFVYMGSGLETNQKYVIKILKKYKNDILKVLKEGVVFLLTGNSFEIFGKSINEDDIFFEGLGIFNFKTSRKFDKRITSDVIFETKILKNPVIGFINKCSEIYDIEDHFFKILSGIGNNKKDKYEGINKFNFFGTHVIGPVLIKNPEFLEKIVEIIAGRLQISLREKNEEKKAFLRKLEFYTKRSFETALKKFNIHL